MSKEERKKYEAEKAETLRIEMEKERLVGFSEVEFLFLVISKKYKKF